MSKRGYYMSIQCHAGAFRYYIIWSYWGVCLCLWDSRGTRAEEPKGARLPKETLDPKNVTTSPTPPQKHRRSWFISVLTARKLLTGMQLIKVWLLLALPLAVMSSWPSSPTAQEPVYSLGNKAGKGSHPPKPGMEASASLRFSKNLPFLKRPPFQASPLGPQLIKAAQQSQPQLVQRNFPSLCCRLWAWAWA